MKRSPETLYLDLMKRCLCNTIYFEHEAKEFKPRSRLFRFFYYRFLTSRLKRNNIRWVVPMASSLEKRALGMDHSPFAHTMIGMKRLDNLQFCMENVEKNNVPGDFIETGVWRGGATIFMRAFLQAYGIKDRVVWVADSFEGLPPPDPEKYPADEGDRLHTWKWLKVSIDDVKENFKKYDLLDDQVRFVKGWFADTLPSAPIDTLAVARLDGDMYGSTMEALVNLYPKVSPGGYVIIDDYGIAPPCKAAVHDYRQEHAITDEIQTIDQEGVYWQKRLSNSG